METQTSDFMQGFYRGRAEGTIKERERIIAYLMEQDVLREAMFYPGLVAYLTDGSQAIDLPLTLGATDE